MRLWQLYKPLLIDSLTEYTSSFLFLYWSACLCNSFSHSFLSLHQSWACEDSDAHQRLSVWVRSSCSILRKLLFLCGAPLSPCYGGYGCEWLRTCACVCFIKSQRGTREVAYLQCSSCKQPPVDVSQLNNLLSSPYCSQVIYLNTPPVGILQLSQHANQKYSLNM